MSQLDALLSDYPAFDAVTFGRHAKAARILAGYDTTDALSRDLRRVGITAAPKAIAEIEAGERVPSYPFVACLAALSCPPGGRAYFEDALSQTVRERLRAMMVA